MRRTLLSVSSALLFVPVTAFALSFTDVPKNSQYMDAITALTDAGVITGNPDGTFRPQNPVNRAALLKMAYVAAKLTPEASGKCFPKDVPENSWFALYVCDAAARKIVSGFENGAAFHPNSMVTVGEAIKILMNVFNMRAPTVDPDDTQIVPFRISRFAWYAPYIVEATRLKILPLPDQGIDFYVNDPVDRQQAAELVYRVWKLWLGHQVSSSSSSSSEISSQSSSASSPVASSSSSSSASQKSEVQPRPTIDIHKVTFPWKEKWQLSGNQPLLYRFAITKNTTIDAHVVLRNAQKGSISCRLYHVQDDGFSPEYYVGVEGTLNCQLLAAIEPGNYQLEVSSSEENAAYGIDVVSGIGDGNDGLSQAQKLNPGAIRQGFLAPNDLEDWYVFTVKQLSPDGDPYILQTTADGNMDCEIQPWIDVNVFGFVGPACNVSTLYTDGTYYVRLKHAQPISAKRTYTLMLRAQ